MRLSAAAELAVRGILVLAEQDGGVPVALVTICKRRKLPKQYMTKLFGQLAHAGLVKTVRGKRGGYLLAKAPGEINMLQVIEAVEGPIILNLCQSTPPQCREEFCKLRPMWTELQNTVKEKLASIKLSEAMRK